MWTATNLYFMYCASILAMQCSSGFRLSESTFEVLIVYKKIQFKFVTLVI
jgi:hypothetical protein